MEAASLGVGIFSAVIQCLGGWEAVKGSCKSSDAVKRRNKRQRADLFVAEKEYLHECRRLLSESLDSDEIDAMFGPDGKEHARWEKDDEVWVDLQKRLGLEMFERATTAIMLCNTTRAKIDKCFLREGSSTHSIGGFTNSEMPSVVPEDSIQSKPHLNFNSKRKIEGQDDKIRELVNRYQGNIVSLRTAINQHTDPQDVRSNCSEPTQKKLHVSRVPDLQESSKALHNALVKTCSCEWHATGVKLQLELVTEKSCLASHGAGAVSRIIAHFDRKIASDPSAMETDAYENLHRAGVQLLDITTRRITRARLPSSPVPSLLGKSLKERPPVTQRKTVSFSLDSLLGKRTENPAKLQKNKSKVVEFSEDVTDEVPQMLLDNKKIEHLCCTLAKLSGFADDYDSVLEENNACLGYITDQDDFQHLFYRATAQNLNAFNESRPHVDKSLFEILHSDNKKDRLATRERIQLAYIVASSILQLHSPSWIQNRFRSKDILLYPRQKNGQSTGQVRWQPYITAVINEMQSIQRQLGDASALANTANSTDIMSTHIFSVGVVILEIGRYEPLLPIQEEIPANASFQEWQNAMEVMSARSLANEMGGRYHDAVNACLMWSADRDLTSESVQRQFHCTVVVQLERCLKKWDSG